MFLVRKTGRRLLAVCLMFGLVCGFPARADEPDAEEKLAARQPNPWIAAVLSLVLPGLGQFYAGERERALIIFGSGAALLTGTLVMNQVAAPDPAGTTPTKPRAPLDTAVFILNMALPTFWAWNVGDAVRLCLPASDAAASPSPLPSAAPGVPLPQSGLPSAFPPAVPSGLPSALPPSPVLPSSPALPSDFPLSPV